MYPWTHYSFQSITLLDAIPSVLLVIVGNLFALLWYEMYLSSNVSITDVKLKKTMKRVIFLFFCYIFLFLAGHVIFIYAKSFDDMNNSLAASILDIFVSGLTSILLFIAGRLVMKNIKLYFSGETKIKIIRKIKFISFWAGTTFIIKSFLTLI